MTNLRLLRNWWLTDVGEKGVVLVASQFWFLSLLPGPMTGGAHKRIVNFRVPV